MPRWIVCNRSDSGIRRHLTALAIVSGFRERPERHLWAGSTARHPRRRPRGAAPEGRSLTPGRTLLVTHTDSPHLLPWPSEIKWGVGRWTSIMRESLLLCCCWANNTWDERDSYLLRLSPHVASGVRSWCGRRTLVGLCIQGPVSGKSHSLRSLGRAALHRNNQFLAAEYQFTFEILYFTQVLCMRYFLAYFAILDDRKFKKLL